MPYQYGTANNADDLLGKLREFLLANGFTVNMWANDASSYKTYSGSGSTEGKRLHVQLGGVYWNFRSAVRATINSGGSTSPGTEIVDGYTQYYGQFSGLAGSPSTGFDAASPWDAQPGAPTFPTVVASSYYCAGAKCVGAIPSYRFFLNLVAMELCISIEYEVGKWRHLILGTLRKYGEYEGGMFCVGCSDMFSPRSVSDVTPFGADKINDRRALFVRVDGASASGWTIGPTMTTNINGKTGGYWLSGLSNLANNAQEASFLDSYDMDVALLASEPSNYTSIVPLIPIRVSLILSSQSPITYQFLGEVAGLRLLRMDGYSPGDIITMGADRWMVLPLTFKEPDKACVGFAIPYDGV